MRVRPAGLLATALLGVLAAGGCMLSLARQRPGGDGSVTPDSGGDSTPPADQAGTVDVVPPDIEVPTTSALQVILSKVLLPTSATDHAIDIDGDTEPDNQLGMVTGIVSGFSTDFDLQKTVDEDLGTGAYILLLDVLANALTDSVVRVVLHQGEDQDGNPDDNFSGNEPFSISGASPPRVFLDGRISGGMLKASGRVILPLRFSDKPALLFLERAQVVARIDHQGLHDGVMGGAVPVEQVKNAILPEIAAAVDETYKSPDIDPGLYEQLRGSFDLNTDGTITADEIAESAVVALVLKPDIDLDGDKIADALSFGLGFAAVPCQIVE